MNRKRAALGFTALIILIVAGLMYALEYQPAFYSAVLADGSPIETRREQATTFEQTALDLYNEVRFEEQWSHEITDTSLNDWLALNLMVRYNDQMPENVSAPRVKFEKDRVLVGFQIRRGMWRGIVHGQISAWVSGPNQLALDIESARLGMIPIPVDEYLDNITRKLIASGWNVEWKNNGRRDVLVLTLPATGDSDGPEHAALESLKLAPGVLRISGRRMSKAEPLSNAGSNAKSR